MKTKCLVVVLLIMSLLFAGGPLAILEAGPIKPHPDESHGADTLRNKRVLIGLPPGTILAHFVVKGKNTPVFDEAGRPNGVFMGDIVGAADGKPVDASLVVSNTDHPASAAQSRLFLCPDEEALPLEPSLEMGEPVMAPPLPAKL